MTFAVLASGAVAFAMLQSLVIPVLTTIQHELGTSPGTATWVVTANLLSASIATPIMGRFGDMFGKRRMFVIALGSLALGSALGATAPSIGVLIVARAIQGVGGGTLPLAFGIIRDEFHQETVTRAIGSLASLTAVGAGLGIVLAGPIVNALDYHWLFWLPMALTGAAAVCAMALVPESPVRAPGRVGWRPALLLSGWLTAFLLALSEGTGWGWHSAAVLGLFAVAALLAAGWVVAELRAETPLVDIAMLRRRTVWTNNLVALLMGVGMYAGFAFIPELVQTPRSAGYGFGADITSSGLMLLPSTITSFIVGMNAGRLARFVEGKFLVFVGCLIGGATLLAVGFAHDHRWEIYLATSVQGIGFGLAYAAMAALVVVGVPQTQTGVASGMNANIRTIGGSIGAVAMATVVTAHLQPSGLPSESGYVRGFTLIGAAMAFGALAALLIPSTRRSRVVVTDHEPWPPT